MRPKMSKDKRDKEALGKYCKTVEKASRELRLKAEPYAKEYRKAIEPYCDDYIEVETRAWEEYKRTIDDETRAT